MLTKEDSLKENGSFNKQFMNVNADIFKTTPFFDSKDIVQVKYEMLRAVSNDENSVSGTAGEFGFSRKTYYQVRKAFDSTGLSALVPKKTGPKGPSKLRGKTAEFIDAYAAEHRTANAGEIAVQLEVALGVRVHPRTIERYFEKKIDSSVNAR